MDERSVEWLRFLPAESRIVLGPVPAAMRQLLAGRLAPAGGADTYVGWGVGPADLPAPDGYRSLVLLNPRGIGLPALRGAAFGHTLAFCAYPSLARARLLIPLDSPRLAARGLDFLAPSRPMARLRRAALLTLARLGQLGRAGDTIVLARREPSDLERVLEVATGLRRVSLGVWVGVPGPYRKLTLQVAAPDGKVVAYAKVATVPAARESVARESACLRTLAARPQLWGALPHQLADLELGDSLVTVQSPGPTGAWPVSFGGAHRAFLAALAEATGSRSSCRESAMWQTMRASFAALEPQLSPAWRARLRAAIERVEGALEGQEVLLSTAHGSFDPWNTRRYPDGRLFVFDWEFAQPGALPLYDFFHFHLTSSISVQRKLGAQEIIDQVLAAGRRWDWGLSPAVLRHAFLGYLVDRAVRRMQYTSWRTKNPAAVEHQDDLLGTVAVMLDRQAEWAAA